MKVQGVIDYEELEKSLKHLEAQFANWQRAKDRPERTALDREGIGESVMQRFGTCYDTLWKTLKRYLTRMRSEEPTTWHVKGSLSNG